MDTDMKTKKSRKPKVMLKESEKDPKNISQSIKECIRILKESAYMNSYIICDGTNNPQRPGLKPYAVIYKTSYLIVRRGSESLSEKNTFLDGLAYYIGNGKWIDHNGGFPSGMIESESTDAMYSECADQREVEEFNDTYKDDYSVKFKYTVYAYAPLPDYPEDIRIVLAGGEAETENLLNQFEN